MRDLTAALALPTPALGRRAIVAAGLVLLAAGAVAAHQQAGWRLAALWLVGAGFGIALYHGAFGFAYGLRAFVIERRSAHLRAQMLMLAAAAVVFVPLLAAGEVFGRPVRGFVFEAGWGVVVGAFVFGIGMQIAGGCVSGTLYTVGGGSPRMLVVLFAAVVGATLAALGYPLWEGLAGGPAVSLPAALGPWPALALTLAVAGLVAALAARAERRRHGAVAPIFGGSAEALVHGPWPYAWAALALALLNVATLLLAGRPWGIAQAFALWGTLGVDRLGLDDPVFWPFWEDPTRVEALHRPLFADTTSVMTIAVVAGAFLAAGLAGRFAPDWRLSPGPLIAAVVGGLLIGFGAIVAGGCNISAYFSGIASGSLHGWLWILAAVPGTWVGARLRPLFGLDRSA